MARIKLRGFYYNNDDINNIKDYWSKIINKYGDTEIYGNYNGDFTPKTTLKNIYTGSNLYHSLDNNYNDKYRISNLLKERHSDINRKITSDDTVEPNRFDPNSIPIYKNGKAIYINKKDYDDDKRKFAYLYNKPTINNNDIDKGFKKYLTETNVSDAIGISSNVIGSLISHNVNRRMLNRMKNSKAPVITKPVSQYATKLKTNVNINPQLDQYRNAEARYRNEVNNNTANSRVALARTQANRLNTLQGINALYGNKENEETKLINQDRLNQQAVANQNIAQYNNYLAKKDELTNAYNQNRINFANTIAEKKAENNVALWNNLNSAVQNTLVNREQRSRDRNTLMSYLLANPNVSPDMINAIIPDLYGTEDVDKIKRVYNKKKQN